MDKEQLKQDIKDMKAKITTMEGVLARMEAELENCGEVELKKGHISLNGNGDIDYSDSSKSYVKNGATRATKELAEIASQNMVARNKLEAYAMQLDPEYKYIEGEFYSSIYKYKGEYNYDECKDDYIGSPKMSKQTAITLCEWLNDGRISLDKV